MLRAATVVQVLQDLFYVLLHVLFYLWSLLKRQKRHQPHCQMLKGTTGRRRPMDQDGKHVAYHGPRTWQPLHTGIRVWRNRRLDAARCARLTKQHRQHRQLLQFRGRCTRARLKQVENRSLRPLTRAYIHPRRDGERFFLAPLWNNVNESLLR